MFEIPGRRVERAVPAPGYCAPTRDDGRQDLARGESVEGAACRLAAETRVAPLEAGNETGRERGE